MVSEREREIWDDPQSEERLMCVPRRNYFCVCCDEVGCRLTGITRVPTVCPTDGRRVEWVEQPEEDPDYCEDDGDPGEYVEWRDYDPEA